MPGSVDLVIFGKGLVSMSVCVPAETNEQDIEEEANRQNPTGIGSRWTMATEDKFDSGSPMPKVCEQDPNRMHWLLHC